MDTFSVIIICAVVLIIFFVSMFFKGIGFIFDILTSPKKLITLVVVIVVLLVLAGML